MVASADAKRHAAEVVKRLRANYRVAECALVHDSPLQLLIATILSAQCTDARVNIVTRELFQTYKSAADFAAAPLAELERAVQSTGFFRNKAKNIKACCQQLVDKHAGQVPKDLGALVELPGVGRKTANVVMGTAFGIASGVVVDTHVTRLSRRLGLTKHTDAVKIERDLIELVPQREWIGLAHRLIHHGRQICVARKPRCEVCPLLDDCPQVGVAVAAKTKAGGKSASRSSASNAVKKRKLVSAKSRS